MLDQDPFTGHQDPHDVELIRLPIASVAVDPDVGAPSQFALFSVMYGLDRVAKLIPFAGFDLDEGDGGVALGNEVDVTAAVPKAPREDAPSFAGEPSFGDPFAEFAEALVVGRHAGQGRFGVAGVRHRFVACRGLVFPGSVRGRVGLCTPLRVHGLTRIEPPPTAAESLATAEDPPRRAQPHPPNRASEAGR